MEANEEIELKPRMRSNGMEEGKKEGRREGKKEGRKEGKFYIQCWPQQMDVERSAYCFEQVNVITRRRSIDGRGKRAGAFLERAN